MASAGGIAQRRHVMAETKREATKRERNLSAWSRIIKLLQSTLEGLAFQYHESDLSRLNTAKISKCQRRSSFEDSEGGSESVRRSP